jgi:hypothetical protein
LFILNRTCCIANHPCRLKSYVDENGHYLLHKERPSLSLEYVTRLVMLCFANTERPSHSDHLYDDMADAMFYEFKVSKHGLSAERNILSGCTVL